MQEIESKMMRIDPEKLKPDAHGELNLDEDYEGGKLKPGTDGGLKLQFHTSRIKRITRI